jgi:hypothetical protein
MERLGGQDRHMTRLLEAIITMSEIEQREIPGGHTVYALHDENGIPTLAIFRASVMLEHDVFPLFTVRYEREQTGSNSYHYVMPPFDLPDPDDDYEGSSWRRVGDNRLAQRIVEVLEQKLVQQEADEIAAMAEVDEADAMFDDDEEEDDFANPTEQIANARQRGMFLGRFASQEYATAYNASERGQRHNVPAPFDGQMYYDTTHERLMVYAGDSWRAVGNADLAAMVAPEASNNIQHTIDAVTTREVAPAPRPNPPAGTQTELPLTAMMSRWNVESGEYILVVNRVSPRTWAGHNITGFLAQFDRQIDESFLEQRFGGGTYDITLRGPHPSTGRRNTFLDGCRIRIAGAPRPSSSALAVRDLAGARASRMSQRNQLERVIVQKRNPVKPCSEVILSTDKPTRLVEAVEEPDDVDS